MDKEAWWVTVHGVAKESDTTERPKKKKKKRPVIKIGPTIMF